MVDDLQIAMCSECGEHVHWDKEQYAWVHRFGTVGSYRCIKCGWRNGHRERCPKCQGIMIFDHEVMMRG